MVAAGAELPPVRVLPPVQHGDALRSVRHTECGVYIYVVLYIYIYNSIYAAGV